jgi:hypothetical protein
MAFKATPRVQIPSSGPSRDFKVVTMSLQIAPDRLWTVAAAQARAAAISAGFAVSTIYNISNRDGFSLPLN